ncbi:hypothetical protein [Gemmata massiliana]|nr:hypothetical protein [Gemmata massiliana]
MGTVEALPLGENPAQPEVMAAWAVAFASWWEQRGAYGDAYVAEQVSVLVSIAAGIAAGSHVDWAAGSVSEVRELRAAVSLLRDIFGNPFRPVAPFPSWRTPTVVALTAQMYESRDFGAMPILADALQDAGCDSADVLDHCRGPGPHVRGCWVVDLVLGRE